MSENWRADLEAARQPPNWEQLRWDRDWHTHNDNARRLGCSPNDAVARADQAMGPVGPRPTKETNQ